MPVNSLVKNTFSFTAHLWWVSQTAYATTHDESAPNHAGIDEDLGMDLRAYALLPE